jgi:hypothetical protein
MSGLIAAGVYAPPGFEIFEAIKFYAFETAELIIFFYGLYQLLKNHLK